MKLTPEQIQNMKDYETSTDYINSKEFHEAMKERCRFVNKEFRHLSEKDRNRIICVGYDEAMAEAGEGPMESITELLKRQTSLKELMVPYSEDLHCYKEMNKNRLKSYIDLLVETIELSEKSIEPSLAEDIEDRKELLEKQIKYREVTKDILKIVSNGS